MLAELIRALSLREGSLGRQGLVPRCYRSALAVEYSYTNRPKENAVSARLALLNGIKGALRARKVTYRELAQSIGVSEATVKRDLSRGSFSLLRLDEICSSLGLTLSDLTQRPEAAEVITELSDSQERA